VKKLFLLLILLCPPALAAQTAVVTRNVNLRKGPSSSKAIIRLLEPPDELVVLDPALTNSYYEVRTAGGDHGWVWSHNVRLTAAPAPAPPPAPTGPAEEYRGCPLEGLAVNDRRKASNTKKNRVTRPGAADIDGAVTLTALLNGGDDEQRWNDTRAASIVGFVHDVKPGGEETVNCGETDGAYKDTHIELVLDPQSTGKRVRVIVEVTPRWRAFMATQGEDWTSATLAQQLEGHWVRFTGWLFWDFEHSDEAANSNPTGTNVWRATAWEIHPVTEIKVCPGTPQSC
jgi:hypothetical protein